MAQTRIHDYRGPRSSENLNGHLVGVVPSGIYEGFHVFANGNVSPGMLITPEGVRIRDTETISVVVPAADPVNPRIDLVVCTHEYEKTVPAPVATFVVVQGVPAADPSWPDLPPHSMLVAACRMEALAVAWTDIQQLGYPVKVYNAEHQDDHSWLILRGSVATTRTLFNPNTGVFAAWIVPPGTYGDDDPITWGAPAFEYSADGVLQILTHIGKAVGAHAASAISILDTANRYTAAEVEAALQEIAGVGRVAETVKNNAAGLLAHVDDPASAHLATAIHVNDLTDRYTAVTVEGALQEIAGAGRTAETVKGNAADVSTNADAIVALDIAKFAKAGGTISGDVVLEGKVTFDATDVANVAFDDYIAFTHWVQPCEGNSHPVNSWENHGYTWKSPWPGGSDVHFYLPIPGIVNAELISVGIGFYNGTAADANVALTYQRGNIDGGIASPTELGSGGGLVPGLDGAVFVFPAVGPADPPSDDEPLPFDTTYFLQLKVTTADPIVIFSGMKCYYRRKRIAV